MGYRYNYIRTVCGVRVELTMTDEMPNEPPERDDQHDETDLPDAIRQQDLAALVFPNDIRSNVEEHSTTYHRHRLMQAIRDAGYAVGYRQHGNSAVISIGRD